jgi:hypothetical protein
VDEDLEFLALEVNAVTLLDSLLCILFGFELDVGEASTALISETF